MTIEDALTLQAASRERLRERTTAIVLQVWASMPSYDEDQVAAFTARVLPLIEAGQRTTALMTTSYIASVISQELGETIVPATVSDLTALRGVDPADVYRRPFVEVWSGLKAGQAWDGAVAVGADRLGRLVQDDLSLAHRRATLLAVGADDRITGYRRVIRPEFSRSGVCGLCAVASTMVYHRGRLMPIHSRCNCEVMPILSTRNGVNDPGSRLNDADLESVYRAVGSTKGADLKRTRVVIHEHGELGPVLTRAGDDFTGPSDIAA